MLYEYDTIEDEYPNSEFIKVDELLDPDGDLAKTAGENPCSTTRKSNVK